ncbi:hypothetical protein [Yersinia bercovieri]|uniref:hypothetical protein n=1 Tax=Yersinia bercovieri TaxID=634 RepID=UPI0030CAD0CC
MTKYSLDIPTAQIGANGLAIRAGWIAVYSADTQSQEFIGVNNEYLPLGVSLPASGYADSLYYPPNQIRPCVETILAMHGK